MGSLVVGRDEGYHFLQTKRKITDVQLVSWSTSLISFCTHFGEISTLSILQHYVFCDSVWEIPEASLTLFKHPWATTTPVPIMWFLLPQHSGLHGALKVMASWVSLSHKLLNGRFSRCAYSASGISRGRLIVWDECRGALGQNVIF